MSIEDETAPVENDETPVTEDAAPEDSGTPAPESDPFEKRYLDLRAEFNEQRALRDRARQGDAEAIKELTGFELAQAQADEEDSEEYEETYQDPRVDALLQEREQEKQVAILNDVSGHIDTLLDDAEVELPQRLKQAILSEAWLRGGGPQITPETTKEVVKEWVDEYKALEKAAGQRYRQSKKSPHVSAVGKGATETPYRDDMSLDERIEAAQEQARLLSSGQ